MTWDAEADAKQNGDLQTNLYFRNRLWVSIKILETSLEDLKDSWLHPTIFAEQNLLPKKPRMMKTQHLDPWKKFVCHIVKPIQVDIFGNHSSVLHLRRWSCDISPMMNPKTTLKTISPHTKKENGTLQASRISTKFTS